MAFIRRVIPAVVCAAGMIVTAAVAHADNIISGTVWINQAPYPAPLGPPTGSPYGTFTVNEINFNSNGSADYTIGSFLTSEGATVTGATYANPGQNLNNTIFQFTGETYLQAGVTYTVTHDDGALLYLDGSSTNVLGAGSGNPTAAENSTFTVGTSGNYSFVLDYAEVNGAPAVLTAPFAAVGPTPEPSAIAMLGTGLLGIAGVARRRLKK